MDEPLAVFIAFLIVFALEEERQRRESRRAAARHRHLRRRALISALEQGERPSRYCSLNTSVPLLRIFLDDTQDTKPDFRLSRESLKVLFQLIKHEGTHGWGGTIEVLVFLFWLACGTSYRVVSRAFAMPRSTVHRVIHRMASEMRQILPKVIRHPKPEELQSISDGFVRLGNHTAFHSVVGAIDGCHVRIKAPGEPDAQCYRNRKLYPSVQFQAVCDHQAKFLDVFIGFPGSVHDARVLRHSTLYRQATFPPRGYMILGDGGYPCISQPIALITPFKKPVRGEERVAFNRHHARARSIIERAFGMLKTRWRSIFLHAQEVNPRFVPEVIAACVTLHNICMGAGDVVQPEEEADEDEEADVQEEDITAVSGHQLREQLCANIAGVQ
ncbi:putative nuclease HARBI1 [Astyanax mexicanus]|uniref:Putative nuclease HARBI1 n=2 Tax=Astyanax mexicanus TaxID=7994 RepID=A0A3B1JNY0_ASTMX|nr:putative nuclease HARBI1 [Astyanax mexicanus]XP_049333643.1 putative nuclease HARBI1 [Astyanax mexicanus]KAG9277982.1 putative nuclease HARBI1 [Astyanax mexicanus]